MLLKSIVFLINNVKPISQWLSKHTKFSSQKNSAYMKNSLDRKLAFCPGLSFFNLNAPSIVNATQNTTLT